MKINIWIRRLFFTACGAAAFSVAHVEACTGIMLKATDGSFVNGRTLEFGIEIAASAAIIPRGYSFTGQTPQGPGMSYQSKYGASGAIAFGHPAIMDGVNEKGLSVGVFYFPGYAQYATITQENQSRALSPIDFSNWILTNFATVDEVREAVKRVVIAPTVIPGWGNEPPPFHYIVYDKAGKSLVIEPINGQLVTYNNLIGTFTNSPTFDWHLTNLRNYLNLDPYNVDEVTVDTLKLKPFGQGSGMVGLPGDFTPPSRFVRAAIFTATATPSTNSEEAVYQVFHILNQFDIPVGVSREKQGDVVHSDYTQVTGVKDPQRLRYFFKTYDDQTIRVVDLGKFDLDAKEIKTLPLSTFSQKAVDVTAYLTPDRPVADTRSAFEDKDDDEDEDDRIEE